MLYIEKYIWINICLRNLMQFYVLILLHMKMLEEIFVINSLWDYKIQYLIYIRI